MDARNKPKLNRDKTELLVISSRFWPHPSLDSIVVGNCRVCPSVLVRNLRVVFDQTLSLENHVNSVCKDPCSRFCDLSVGQL